MRTYSGDKLWRAFPELDRFDDAHCRAFVRVANASWRLRLLRYAVVAVLGGLTVVGCMYAFSVLSAWTGKLQLHPAVEMLLLAAGAVAELSLGFGLVLLLNDRLRWRRVRRVLADSGQCSECRYPLLGMPVPASLEVRCPECGAVTQVDEALGELAVSGTGDRTFAPVRPRMNQRGVRRRRKIVRIGLYGTLAVLGAAMLVAAGAVVFVHYEAAQARQNRDGAAKLRALRASLQPIPGSSGDAGVEDAESNWAAYLAVLADANELRERVVGRHAAAGKHVPEPTIDLSVMWRPFKPPAGQTQEQSEQLVRNDQANRELAREYLAELEASGWIRRLHELSKRGVFVRPVAEPAVDSGGAVSFQALNSMQPQELTSQEVVFLCRAMMQQAATAGDREKYLNALDTGLFVARVVEAQASYLDLSCGVTYERLLLASIRAEVARFPDVGFLGELRAILKRRVRTVDVGSAILAERITAEQSVRWIFARPWAVLRAHATGELPEPFYDIEQALGTYRTNMNFLAELSKSWSERFRSDPVQRRKGWIPPPEEFDFSWPLSALEHYSKIFDSYDASRRGTEVVLALEAFRLTKGKYPETLDELTPEFIDVLPNDPFAHATFRFLRVDPASDSFGRAYLLYSIGADGVDNRGASVPGQNTNALRLPQGKGYDFIINQPAE